MKLCASALTLALLASGAFASSGTDDFLSGTGFKLFLAYGAYHSFQSSKEEGVRSLDSLLTAGILAEGLQQVTHVQRPDHSDHLSFPSVHASTASAIATFEAQYHPKEAPFWYLGAVLIGQSRVDLHRHHQLDVLAGDALGYFVSTSEIRSKGFIIQPTATGATILGYGIKF